eukprot:8378139-Alexandrium_andersonii.AAC.1
MQNHNESNEVCFRKLLKYDESTGNERLIHNFQRGRGLPPTARQNRGAPPPSVYDLTCSFEGVALVDIPRMVPDSLSGITDYLRNNKGFLQYEAPQLHVDVNRAGVPHSR